MDGRRLPLFAGAPMLFEVGNRHRSLPAACLCRFAFDLLATF
jgi:hypothetical protein